MPKAAPANSESLTRKRLIDRKLNAAGWEIAPFRPNKSLSAWHDCAVEEFETANGPADYVLCRNGKILAVVEAKKLSLGPQNVLVQAERYSRGIQQPDIGSSAFRRPVPLVDNTVRSSGITTSAIPSTPPAKSPPRKVVSHQFSVPAAVAPRCTAGDLVAGDFP